MPRRAPRYERCLDESYWRRIVAQIEAVRRSYTGTAKLFSLGLASRLRRKALRDALALAASARVVVDIGSGPGDSVAAVKRELAPSYIVCIDPSHKLLETCKSRAGAGCPLTEPVVAVAEHLPVRDGAADIVSSFYALRDYQRLLDGLREALRAASGAVALGDVFLPARQPWRSIVKLWTCRIVPLLARILDGRDGENYGGICDTLEGWLSTEELAGILEAELGAAVEKLGTYAFGGLGFLVARPRRGDGGKRGSLRAPPHRSIEELAYARGGDIHRRGAESS